MNENFETNVHIADVEKRYETKGYFTRLIEMFKGLGLPHESGEYKLARLELQRQSAPICAVLLVGLCFTITAVLTMVDDGGMKEELTVQIYEEPDIQIDPTEIQDDPPEPEPVEPEVNVEIDTPTPQTVSEITPIATPIDARNVSVKPAKVERVAAVDSPVFFRPLIAGRPGTPGFTGFSGNRPQCYGDPATELCVNKVLWWLKATQNTDGSWTGGANALANTGLAVLTYLAHGEFPGSTSVYERDFGPVVREAIDWLCNQVSIDSSGKCVMRGTDGNEYAFLIAIYALCEAYSMTHNPNCKDVAYNALNRIVQGQSPTGGWDYKLNPTSTRDDMSFEGWALQALKAGKLAGLHPEGLDACIKKAVACRKKRNFENGGFNYTAGGNPTGLTATGCLALQLLGYGGQSEVRQALDYMRDWQPSFDPKQLSAKAQGTSPQYYCYYATQCKYQAGMKQGATKEDEIVWQNWNLAMKKLYTSVIIDHAEPVLDYRGKEHRQGHYENQDAHSSRPVMDSCLTALQLMVYYRYLPTTQTAAATDDAGVASVDVERESDVPVDVIL